MPWNVDMSDLDRTELTRQYESPPVAGMRRFWMSVETWLEEFPDETPFFFWHTGSGMEYRLRPSVVGTSEAGGLPPQTDLDRRNMSEGVEERFEKDEDLHDRMYVSNAMVCMLVDAPDETAAWDLVRSQFPDMRERFINPADHKTLPSFGRGGRFDVPSSEDESPRPLQP
jgi:hypothetical protein